MDEGKQPRGTMERDEEEKSREPREDADFGLKPFPNGQEVLFGDEFRRDWRDFNVVNEVRMCEEDIPECGALHLTAASQWREDHDGATAVSAEFRLERILEAVQEETTADFQAVQEVLQRPVSQEVLQAAVAGQDSMHERRSSSFDDLMLNLGSFDGDLGFPSCDHVGRSAGGVALATVAEPSTVAATITGGKRESPTDVDTNVPQKRRVSVRQLNVRLPAKLRSGMVRPSSQSRSVTARLHIAECDTDCPVSIEDFTGMLFNTPLPRAFDLHDQYPVLYDDIVLRRRELTLWDEPPTVVLASGPLKFAVPMDILVKLQAIYKTQPTASTTPRSHAQAKIQVARFTKQLRGFTR
jgi:hypothetical protein